jgi:hypothetical protein
MVSGGFVMLTEMLWRMADVNCFGPSGAVPALQQPA